MPLLPAVAEIDILRHALEDAFKKRVFITGIPRAKFIAPILPESDLLVTITTKDQKSLQSEVQSIDGSKIATGEFTFLIASSDRIVTLDYSEAVFQPDDIDGLPSYPKCDDKALLASLPHRGKMRLIDGLLSMGKRGGAATKIFFPSDPTPFSEEKGIPSYVSIEMIAEVISAYGHIVGEGGKGDAKPGFIMRILDFKAYSEFLEYGYLYTAMAYLLSTLPGEVYHFRGALLDEDFSILAVTDIICKNSSGIDEWERMIKG